MKLSIITALLFFSLFHPPTFALKKSYVVYLGSHSHGPEATLSDIESVTNSHLQLLDSVIDSVSLSKDQDEGKEQAKDKIFYSYTQNINGFAAVLEDEEAEKLSNHPEVISVFENKARELHTTRSWNFLGLERDFQIPASSIWTKAKFGEDVIIANLDTGVWPEAKSFSDEGMGEVPSNWRGICQNDSSPFPVRCNRKLIGARYFNKGYGAYAGPLNSSFNSARDTEGHGTHTLSTAGGNFVKKANIYGNGNGTAKGGSPKARVASYKVCWPPINESGQCFDADILAGFDAAISDRVNVISVSLGSAPSDFFEDPIAIGAFHAVRSGISVVASAGNSGPDSWTVANGAPWIITVGASTMDRQFSSYVSLGPNQHFKGTSLSEKGLPAEKFYSLITGAAAKADGQMASDALLCKPGTLDPKKVKGKILFCLRGETGRVAKGEQALRAGAVGMILANDAKSGHEILADTHLLPASHINFQDGVSVLDYFRSTRIPMAYMTRVKTELETKPAPSMAAFSSRGPNLVEPAILKPDITAPGVNIIAAYTQAIGPSGEEFDTRRIPFNTESGTSMSCPHVAGIVGLLRNLYPHWSPAAIQSAIMTSARTRDNNQEPLLDSSTNEKATPLDYGSGHVQPNRAMDPGLVYDLSVNDYLNYLCSRSYNQSQIRLFSGEPYTCPKSVSLADFNYPSITVTNLSNGTLTVTRRLKNVGTPGTYNVSIKQPAGFSISVDPKSLVFEKIGEEKTFKASFKGNNWKDDEDAVFGGLTWSDGKHFVRSPIVFLR
ncbi:Subtilase family protein [Euphorbia peplus]|nr:Subtilase family protein [Euphorbia peplus]